MRPSYPLGRGLWSLWAVLLLVPGPAAADGGHHTDAPPEILETVRYYVHGFDDPEASEYTMNRTAPTGETPQTETCLVCAGDAELAYNFTTEDPIPQDWEVKNAMAGAFVFWIRAYEPQDGVAVPPYETTVSFELRAGSAQVLFGSGAKTVNITATQPQQFLVPFVPQLDGLPEGVDLRWNVQVTGVNGVYNPAAAPYGVSAEFPFYIQFVRVVPQYGIDLQVHPYGPDIIDLEAGRDVTFNFTVDNHGTRNTTVMLGVSQIPSNATATIRRASDGGVPADPFLVTPGASLLHSLTVTGLPLGNHSIRLDINSTKGESGAILFLARVKAAAPAEDEAAGAPGFEALAAVAAVAAAWTTRRRAGKR